MFSVPFSWVDQRNKQMSAKRFEELEGFHTLYLYMGALMHL